ncbi:protein turtle-like [Oppia nitens]|uniref:protein turtle-like n=1 Tax=Oppia nitens TaxID=1686743 RepID=UPI0023DAD06C|nr:protein turtle-like [Oppia nitens]
MLCNMDLCLICIITSILWLSLWTQTIQGFTSDESHAKISANLGDNVMFNCAFDFPDKIEVPYVIHWQKKGVKIPIYIWYDGYPPHLGEGYEGRVALTNPTKEASLNLSNVRESDQGWYECKVYFLNQANDQLKNGTFVLLDVHAPPHFESKPPEFSYVRVGSTLTLNCIAVGTPSPTVVWQKDNLPIETKTNIKIVGSELRIENLGESDIGDYQCVAKNRQGSVTANTKVIVAGPAVISLPPKNTTKLEGDKVELTCEAKALPANVTYRWFHKGIEISQLSWLVTRTVVKKDGTLLINPTSAEDTGKFTCDAFNGIGDPDTASAYLTIEYPARVTYSPSMQYLPFGLSGVVRCFIQASPPFQFVTWTRDRRAFDPIDHPGVKALTNGSLLFERVTHEHQGRYRCTPYNLHGTAGTSSVMEVFVREPPIFTIKPPEFYQKPVGSDVIMACDGVGNPKPIITWRKTDGSKLPKDRTFIRSGNLTIKSIKKEDHGKYDCVLDNIIATLVTSTTLLVDSTTPHAPTNVSVNTSAFAATVTWVPNHDGGHQQHFSIRYRFSDEDETGWMTLRPPEATSAFTIYNLKPDTEYDFQVFASNSLGRGMGSNIIRARTKSWDGNNSQYPTDAYGSTYSPIQPAEENTKSGTTDTLAEPTLPSSTTAAPTGPKPGHVRNVTIEKMAQGWVVSWLPPLDKSTQVAYYTVEYKEGDEKWITSEAISKDTAYLIKDLQQGSKYTIRVNAYNILGIGDIGQSIDYKITGPEGMRGPRAITAGIVGSVLFFVAAIILSVCTVKICNKRKRRKLEKAYMMVTCPVMDGVNGSHSHGGSPVTLKQSSQNNIKAHNDLICSLGTPGSLLDMRKAEYQV